VTAYKQLSYELLGLQPDAAVLEVGCGVGDDARSIAERIAPGGRVVAIDSDPNMVAAARARGAAQAGGAGDEMASHRVDYLVAQAEALPLDLGSFDAARADRVLQHVDDPDAVLRQIKHVLSPGAVVVLVEPDWKTMAVYPGSPEGGDDDRTFNMVTERWRRARIRHPLMGRQLRTRLQAAGFTEIHVYPVAYATDRFAVADLVLELSTAVAAARAGDIPQLTGEEASAWLDALGAADAAGQFYAIVPLVFAKAIRPLE
jgi:SAM-dependent methyltransferase